MRYLSIIFAAVAILAAGPALAQSWSFDQSAVVASASRSGASLHVACAQAGQLGVLYQLDRDRLAAELRGKSDTVFAFADAGGTGVRHTTVEVPLRIQQGKAFLAFYGDAARSIIDRIASAPSVVVAGIGLEGSDGFDLFNLTRFSASGSGAAIAKVAAACRR